MARKRYETAFLPNLAKFDQNSVNSSGSNNISPDADSLLLAIETTSLVDPQLESSTTSIINNPNAMRSHGHHHHHGHRHSQNSRHQSPSRNDHPLSSSTGIATTVTRSPHLNLDSPKSMALSVSKYVKKYLKSSSSSSPSPSTSHPASPSYRQEIVVADVISRVSHTTHNNDDYDEEEEEEELDIDEDEKKVKITSSCSRNTNTNINNPNPINLPLSEPLPIRNSCMMMWSGNRQVSSSSMSMSISSASSSAASPLPPQSSDHTTSPHSNNNNKRNSLNLTKDNSISSLESLDSTKSENLHISQNLHPKFRGNLNYHSKTSKLLSPISDKSPLEPSKSMTVVDIHHHRDEMSGVSCSSSSSNRPRSSDHHEQDLLWHDDTDDDNNSRMMRAAELTNVPWEMPKLRRKLAGMGLFCDSGIGLDLPVASMPRDSFSTHSFFNMPERKKVEEKRQQSSFSPSHSQYPQLQHHHHQEQSIPNPDYGDDNNADRQGQYDKRGTLDLKLPLLKKDSDFCPDDYNNTVGDYEEGRGNYLPVDNNKSLLNSSKPDRCKVWLDFSGSAGANTNRRQNPPVDIFDFDPDVELECQEWFHGLISRLEAEDILRPTREGSFLVRNCESTTFNQYSLSLKCARGFIHIRIEINSLGTFSLGDHEFPSVPKLVLHFMKNRLPIRGGETLRLLYPVLNQVL